MAASVETVKSFTREFLVEFEQKVPVPSQLKERIFELVLSRGQALVVKKPKVKRTAQTDADVTSTKADTKALIKAKSQSAIQKPAKKPTQPEATSVVAKPATKVAEKPAQPAKERKALAPIVAKTSTALKPKPAAAPKATAAAVVAKTVTTKAVVDKENDANAASSSLLNIAKGVATKATGLKLQAQKPAVTKTVKPVAVAAKPVPAIPKDEVLEDGESDEARLRARQKQIEYGKNTDGYRNYVAKVPKDQRVKGMPSTPEKYQKCSKRSWDGQVRKWRRQLHAYDPAPASLSDDLDLIDGEDLSTRFNELQLGQGSLKATDAFSLEDKPRAVKVLQF